VGEAAQNQRDAALNDTRNDNLGPELMTLNGRLRWKLAIGLLAAVAFDTLLQVTWKTTVLETPDGASPWATLGSVFSNPLFVGVIVIMTFQFFNWLMVLGQADLSYAKPIASLSYAAVPILSVLLLNEAFDIVQVAGVAFVIIGVWFISQSKPLREETSKIP
jgi:drug/metabolite transporter (DMT)-like permease